MAGADRDIVVGEVVAPFGIRGEVKVIVLTDFPERFSVGNRLTLELAGGKKHLATIQESRSHKAGLVIRLDCAETIDDAEKLRGAQIVVDRSELMELGSDEFYVFDLLGLKVTTDDGRELGEVAEVLQSGGNDVYVTSSGVCIPALRSVVTRIDVAEGVMIVHPVPGLLPEE